MSERVRARAVAWLGGPAHAREAIERRRRGRAWPPATATCAASSARCSSAGGLSVETTDDVTGAELAACAKNAAALASAAAAVRGANLAGAAAGRVFSRGARAGARAAAGAARPSPGWPAPATSWPPRSPRAAATAAPASWSARRAAGAGRGRLGQTAESLATVPLLAGAFEREGIEPRYDRPAQRVLDGDDSPEQWLESIARDAEAPRTRAA